jgi:hypothetical protein
MFTRGFDRGDKVIGIVALVGNDGLCRQVFDRLGGVLDIRDLTGRQNDSQRIAQGIDRHVEFGGQPSSRTSDFLTTGFFWAPAECLCARTIVESRNTRSNSFTRFQTLLLISHLVP